METKKRNKVDPNAIYLDQGGNIDVPAVFDYRDEESGIKYGFTINDVGDTDIGMDTNVTYDVINLDEPVTEGDGNSDYIFEKVTQFETTVEEASAFLENPDTVMSKLDEN